jgi:DNA-binding HxlR family transcriptional regulator
MAEHVTILLHFDDCLNELKITLNTLSDRLRRLVDNGLLARSCYREKPARWEYIRTEKTMDFAMVPLMLGLWADKWLPLPLGGPSIVRIHSACGKPVQVQLICDSCENPLEFDGTVFQEEQIDGSQ